MGDVAQILGVKDPPPAHHQPSKAQQATADKPLWNLVDGRPTAPLPPMVPEVIRAKEGGPDTVKVGSKWISTKKKARPWVWAPFSSSSRTDGTLLHHWVRANVEYPDYPFARFDIHLDPVVYTDDEYTKWLTSKEWTKGETDQLMDFARRFELRWAVIYDRWLEFFDMKTSRRIEDLQHRYYQVAAVLNQRRLAQQAAAEAQIADAQATASTDPAATEALVIDAAAARSLAAGNPDTQPLIHHIGTGSSNKVFDLPFERERRAYQESLWTRSKQDELKETKLRAELKEIEAQLRKLKRKGAGVPGGAATSGPSSRSVTPLPDPNAVNNTFAPPTPVPGVPYLQSARLEFPPVGGGNGINKALLQRLEVLLEEMKVPNPPTVPTKRVCDLYDKVRRDALELLIYQKNVLQKEGLLQNRRTKLEKMTGTALAASTEEGNLGIPPRKPTPAAVPKKKAASASTTAGSGGTGKKKKGDADGGKGKRKRKVDSKSPTGAAAKGDKPKSAKAAEPPAAQQIKKAPPDGKAAKKRPRKS